MNSISLNALVFFADCSQRLSEERSWATASSEDAHRCILVPTITPLIDGLKPIAASNELRTSAADRLWTGPFAYVFLVDPSDSLKGL